MDPLGRAKGKEIGNYLRRGPITVKTQTVYTFNARLGPGEETALVDNLLVDKVTQRVAPKDEKFDWLIEVGFKPGVTDNVGQTAKKIAVPQVLKRQLGDDEAVHTSTQYLISGDLTREEVEAIGKNLLANQVIETIRVFSKQEVMEKGIPIVIPSASTDKEPKVKSYNLAVDDKELIVISKKGIFSLNLEEMRAISEYFKREDVIAARKKAGMEKEFWNKPTDVELEVIAQTWSEHCKHKIFNAEITYTDHETGVTEHIDSIFKTFIKDPSNRIAKGYGWVVSAFDDNAGAVKFNDRLLVVIKNETHNAPSALDPYGGAMTGIVGVNRDPMGFGIGAQLVFNIYAYCFGNQDYGKELPEEVMHPKRIRDGVHKGVIDGGNQSGIPLISGREFFDERFTFRPLVFCGTIGVMPIEINGRPSHLKKAEKGDFIVMVGGRIGKDGIHGATFSSAEIDKESPVQAVQIGDPITQRKMYDFLIEARDLGLYKSITDNGAGGLSSSVGEMARDTNGCMMQLKNAPLKYSGLDPWEIMVSEAQERMTLAVDPTKIKEFMELAKRRGVEATIMGKFEESGLFKAMYGDKIVAHLDMNFLHEGVPKMKLNAEWRKPNHYEPDFEVPKDMNKTLEDMMSRPNICSKEEKIRQYDHEVKGLSVIKPLVGKHQDMPSDATVSFLEYGSKEALAVSTGLNPHYSEIDPYHMTASVIDEALRRVIAVGGKLPDKSTPVSALDNFCWNISAFDTDDGKYKLGQLYRSGKALEDYCDEFGVPCISGKDSPKNVRKIKTIVDGKEVEIEIGIPPTLLFTITAKIDDVNKLVTMDAKRAGDLVYVVGDTKAEMGGSEYFSMKGEQIRGERYIGNSVPTVQKGKAPKTYAAVVGTTQKELAHSMHTPTLGGLGVAFAETAMGGGLGMEVDLSKVQFEGPGRRDDYVLFSQSNSRFVVTVPKENAKEFEKLMEGVTCQQVGVITEENRLKVKGLSGEQIIDYDLDKLRRVWSKDMGEQHAN